MINPKFLKTNSLPLEKKPIEYFFNKEIAAVSFNNEKYIVFMDSSPSFSEMKLFCIKNYNDAYLSGFKTIRPIGEDCFEILPLLIQRDRVNPLFPELLIEEFKKSEKIINSEIS